MSDERLTESMETGERCDKTIFGGKADSSGMNEVSRKLLSSKIKGKVMWTSSHKKRGGDFAPYP